MTSPLRLPAASVENRVMTSNRSSRSPLANLTSLRSRRSRQCRRSLAESHRHQDVQEWSGDLDDSRAHRFYQVRMSPLEVGRLRNGDLIEILRWPRSCDCNRDTEARAQWVRWR